MDNNHCQLYYIDKVGQSQSRKLQFVTPNMIKLNIMQALEDSDRYNSIKIFINDCNQWTVSRELMAEYDDHDISSKVVHDTIGEGHLIQDMMSQTETIEF